MGNELHDSNKTAHWNKVVIPDRVRERAFTRWVPDLECWISTYSTGSHGYAQIGWQGETKTNTVLAHRAAWEHVNGPVPAGMTIDHTCKTRRCVNPDHLRILSNYENARRTAGRDWPLGQCINGHSNEHLEANVRGGKTHCRVCANEVWKSAPKSGARKAKKEPKPKWDRNRCRNGHKRTPDNQYLRPSGYRECLDCKTAYAKLWRQRQQEASDRKAA